MKMRMTSIQITLTAAALLGGLSSAFSAQAQDGQQSAKPDAAGAPAIPGKTSTGEVKKIDKPAGKITIQHGPLVNLSMPGMTMVFTVKDPTMLDSVQVGDNIHFVAKKVNGSLTLTQLEASK